MAKDLARRALMTLAAVLLSGLATGSFAPSAHAAGTAIHVNTTADDTTVDGNCSFREAVQAANTDHAVDGCPAGNGTDTIFLGIGRYKLTHGPLELTTDLG